MRLRFLGKHSAPNNSPSFWIFDETRVQVETVTAGLDITQPAEISLYTHVFDLLQRSAVYGQGARELIGRAVGDLSRE